MNVSSRWVGEPDYLQIRPVVGNKKFSIKYVTTFKLPNCEYHVAHVHNINPLVPATFPIVNFKTVGEV